jgi:hypothetical protein
MEAPMANQEGGEQDASMAMGAGVLPGRRRRWLTCDCPKGSWSIPNDAEHSGGPPSEYWEDLAIPAATRRVARTSQMVETVAETPPTRDSRKMAVPMPALKEGGRSQVGADAGAPPKRSGEKKAIPGATHKAGEALQWRWMLGCLPRRPTRKGRPLMAILMPLGTRLQPLEKCGKMGGPHDCSEAGRIIPD